MRIVKSSNSVKIECVFWMFGIPLGKMSPAKNLRWSVAVSSERACRAFTDGTLGFPRYIRGGPKRMQWFWSVISTTLLIENRWILLYWIGYSFPSNLTQSSSSMDKAFWFYGYFSEAVLFSKCATFPPASSWNLVPQSCVMNASLSFILSSFSKWGREGNCAFVTTADSEINSNCFKPVCGGKAAHFENDTATE